MKSVENKEKIKSRCAIYTRKSHEEGLEQAFNSLDAQRMAGESYIASQAHEGWECSPTQYNDGGYSGGNLDRPALQRLLQDIRDDKIDCIVVYKIDRLTRSLLDFSKIIELLDENKCSFVAVTQSFNTSNSMGRLMLNVLLSFAQYERELTSERIRDKFEISSKLGIWMGGTPPLGYDPKDRALHINKKEEIVVKAIYDNFLNTESITETLRKINELGYTTKSWVSSGGRKYQGVKFSKKAIYHILQNPIYAGKIVHKGKVYDGKHVPIIDPEAWRKTQEIFTSPRKLNKSISRVSNPPLLKGVIFCGCCNSKMTPSYSVKKNGSKYRYYICSAKKRLANESCQISSVAAAIIETSVIDYVLKLLAKPEVIANVLAANAKSREEDQEILFDNKIIGKLQNIEKVWYKLFPIEQIRIIHLLIERVIISKEGLEIIIYSEGMNELNSEINNNGSNKRKEAA